MKPLIVVPTYNERENLSALVPAVLRYAPRAHLLVVDDASPDGTARAALDLGRRHRGRVHLLRRSAKLGLGSAYVEGFRWALARKFDPVIQMDADGSHDPAALPEFLAQLRVRDAAVGTRYRSGVRVINWPWSRLCLSLAANWYARLVTGVPLTDLTGGYNGWRAHVLARLGLDRLRCNGYAFQIELKARCHACGFRMAEVPIVFAGRVEGKSKLSRAVVWEAVWAVWRIRFGA